MVQYILECIAFQWVFLLIYDLFLKRETFFQWNRAYLISTYVLSLLLPWVTIEAFKTTVPEQYYVYPEFFWNMNTMEATVTATKGPAIDLSWQEGVFYSGMFVATLIFGYKLYQIHRLRQRGKVEHLPDFTRIIVRNSELAFSFFRSIFLGDKVVRREHGQIIRHELVHIRQKHSYDLMFFELMRIIGWFNPLVYVYQSRISELHEFIADAHTAKTHKREQYEFLLSQVFQTEHISFINQFFKRSLIKKRIVMLQKKKSGGIWKLKYLALLPVVVGMLFYSSCENEVVSPNGLENIDGVITVADIENLTEEEENFVYGQLKALSEKEGEWQLNVTDAESNLEFKSTDKDVFITGIHNDPIRAQMSIQNKASRKFYKSFLPSFGEGNSWKETYEESNRVPYALTEEPPVFPGCESDADPRACFTKMIQKHIAKSFRYPEEAQQQGIQGRVNVMFSIDETGNITDIRKRGPHKLLEDEVVRIIEKLPRMKPGKYQGKAVKVPYSIPITFKLRGEENISSPKLSFDTGQESIPLILIDGKESTLEQMESLAPEDIESVNVLKDDKAIREHGEKGKNGVINVITKKGQSGTDVSGSTYKADRNTISVSASAKNNGVAKVISGTVTDGMMPFPGVNISIQESGRGVVSDFDGKFTINVKKGDVIQFQYIGLPTTELAVTNEETYQITKKG